MCGATVHVNVSNIERSNDEGNVTKNEYVKMKTFYAFSVRVRNFDEYVNLPKELHTRGAHICNEYTPFSMCNRTNTILRTKSRYYLRHYYYWTTRGDEATQNARS